MKLSEKIVSWIKNQVQNSGKKGIILGLSGGIDSAVVGVLSKLALGNNVLGLTMPCGSHPEDAEFAAKLAGIYNIKTKEIPLDGIFKEFVKVNPKANNIAKANLKPRTRMTMLYYFANSLNYLVAGTGNKSELLVGYFTKHGDGGVDILPIGGLLKTEVIDLAKEIKIPDDIINRPPSAGLWPGQTDEKEMGITYDELDKTIIAIEKNDVGGIDKGLLDKVRKMMLNSEHKRTSAPIFNKGN